MTAPSTGKMKFWLPRLLVVIALAAGAWWGWTAYFRVKSPFDQYKEFYGKFRPGEAVISSERLKDLVWDGGGSEFERLAVEAAFSHYRADPSPTGSFYKMMNAYQHGSWSVPDTVAWRTEFDTLVSQWDQEREQVRKQRLFAATPETTNVQDLSMKITFTDTTTVMIGTRMELDIELSNRAIADRPVNLLVCFDSETPLMFRFARWTKCVRQNGRYVGTLELDFSREIEWYRPGRRFTSLGLHDPEIARAKLKALRLRD